MSLNQRRLQKTLWDFTYLCWNLTTMKRKERKRDRTPLDEYTIRAYEGLVRDFIYITKCQYPGDVTGDRVNDWMLVLEAGYVGPDGKKHKPSRPRTVYNLFTNLGCFLRYCGIEPNPSTRHSYGLRKLTGTNVPGKDEPSVLASSKLRSCHGTCAARTAPGLVR